MLSEDCSLRLLKSNMIGREKALKIAVENGYKAFTEAKTRKVKRVVKTGGYFLVQVNIDDEKNAEGDLIYRNDAIRDNDLLLDIEFWKHLGLGEGWKNEIRHFADHLAEEGDIDQFFDMTIELYNLQK